MQSLKIFVAGAESQDRSDFIKVVSEIPVFSTDRYFSDGQGQEQSLSVEFGRLTIAQEMTLHMFGTSSKESSFDLLEHLASGVLGFVLLLEPNASSWSKGQQLTKFLKDGGFAYVLAVKTTPKNLKRVTKRLKVEAGTDGRQVVACEPKDKDSVKGVLLQLMEQLLQS